MDILVREDVFRFKMFDIHQDQCHMKVCTDGILLGAWARLDGVRTSLDIGTGSGVITLMLAQRSDLHHAGLRPDLERIIGVEIEECSYQQARHNAAQSDWSDRLEMVHASVQDFMYRTEDTYDLIISNPPFFTGGTLSESQARNDVRHTVKLPHSDLLRAVKKLMSPNGHFAVILPVMEGYRFIELAEQYWLYLSRKTEVYSRSGKAMERLLLEFSHQENQPLDEDRLYIHTGNGNEFSPEYQKLTGDFYLNL